MADHLRGALLGLMTRAVLLLVYGTALVMYPPLCLVGRVLRWRGQKCGPTGPDPDCCGGVPAVERFDVLVIGTFYTRNWCRSHLLPLARAGAVRRVYAVVDGPTEPIPGVEYLRPRQWMLSLFGRALSKLCVAGRVALGRRPQLVMGYHLFPGALTALLVARATGVKAAYQMTGGPVELVGGGSLTENVLIKHLRTDSWLIERLVFMLVGRFDLIVVRGGQARQFMLQRRLASRICIVPGSVDTGRFESNGGVREYDVVSLGRLAAVKQPEQMLEVLARVRQQRPALRAIFLGDGPLLSTLRELSRRLGLEGNVTFAGHVEDVHRILTRSKVFLLTSRSEGLSIAMAEAMAAGAVPVVADVGDLGDLVRNTVTGWRVMPGAIDEYAQRVTALLDDEQLRARMLLAARERVIKHNDVASVAERWSRTIKEVCAGAGQRSPEPAPISAHHGNGRIHKLSHWRASIALPSRRRAWELMPRRVKSLVRPVARAVPPRYWLGRRFRECSALLARADRWPVEEAERYQLEQLRRICRIAQGTPFFGGIFRDLGFEPMGLNHVEEFRCLPTIDAETVRSRTAEMLTVPPDSPDVDRVSTGGTSGRPLHFHINRGRSAVEYAHLVASWQRVGYRLDIAQAVIRGHIVPEDRHGLRHEYDPVLRRHYFSNYHMSDENMGRYLEHIARIGECYLHVYPSSAAAMARYIERSGIRPPANIRGVLAGSENVYEPDRQLVERAFGVRFFSWYGHSEKAVLAAECEHSDIYHVWPTYGYVELVDENGKTIRTPGHRGEIVATGFINTVMPLIRYRTGDYATYSGAKCEACGREQMLISEVRGHRTQEMLVAGDGALISWTALNMHDDTFDRVRQFQFQQVEPGRATLRLIPADGFGNGDVERIHRKLSAKLCDRLVLDIQLTDRIPLTAMGKRTYVDQRLDLEAVSQKEVIR